MENDIPAAVSNNVSPNNEAEINSAINISASRFDVDFCMQDIADELQENIGQTAACIKLLLSSLNDPYGQLADKLHMIDHCMTILMNDIKSLTSRVIEHTGK
jgi:hypothetical protein